MPITVKLLILSALQMSASFFTLYRLFQMRPTPTAIYRNNNDKISVLILISTKINQNYLKNNANCDKHQANNFVLMIV